MNRYLEKAAELNYGEKAGYSVLASAPIAYAANELNKNRLKDKYYRYDSAAADKRFRLARMRYTHDLKVVESIAKKTRGISLQAARLKAMSAGKPGWNALPKRLAVGGLAITVPSAVYRKVKSE